MNEAETRHVADRIETTENARSNYITFLVTAGFAAAVGIFMVIVDRSGNDSAGWFVMRMFFPLAILLPGALWGQHLYEVYKGRKTADDMAATHFRLQLRTFLIYLLYAFVMGLIVGISGLATTGSEAAVAGGYVVFAWFVIRCIKGLKCLRRQEPYPNPGTWLW